MRNLIKWLVNSLGLAVPGMLIFSSRLAGTNKSQGTQRSSPEKSLLEQLRTRLDIAEMDLNDKDWKQAEVNLGKADNLAKRIQAHTPEFESLKNRKTDLWEICRQQELDS